MYSLAHARVNSRAMVFMSAWTAVIHNSFLHAFDSDAVDMPLRPMANRFGGCFCLGSGPVFWVLLCFLLFASLFPLAKRKSGWGICGSSLFVWLWFSVLLLQSICRLQGPFVLVQCIFCLLSCKDRAISATSATLEEKKKTGKGQLGRPF